MLTKQSSRAGLSVSVQVIESKKKYLVKILKDNERKSFEVQGYDDSEALSSKEILTFVLMGIQSNEYINC